MGYIVLRGERAIRKKIRGLFSTRTRSRRRLILGPLSDLVGFDYLPDMHNVELYSWGQDSFDDQAPLAILAEKGVSINWVNPSHLKLYWVEGKGAVIGPGFETGPLLTEMSWEDQTGLALYLDATASMVVDEVLCPSSWDPTADDTTSNFQENCDLLWRLAEGITLAGAIRENPPRTLSISALTSPDESSLRGDTALEGCKTQESSSWESWYNFLAEEVQKPEGLLCFYDRPPPKRVENCCRFFLGLGGPLAGGSES